MFLSLVFVLWVVGLYSATVRNLFSEMVSKAIQRNLASFLSFRASGLGFFLSGRAMVPAPPVKALKPPLNQARSPEA